VSVEDLGNLDDELPRTQTSEEAVESELDFPALVRLLLDVIPNPWQGARILQETFAELRKRKIKEERIIANRLFLVKAMRDNLKEQVHQTAEADFRRMLESNELCFRLESSNDPKLNWNWPRRWNST
jgi:type III restriction enzyme